MKTKNLSFLSFIALFLFLSACEETVETDETGTTVREEVIEVEPEPEEEVYTIEEDDPFELEREESINDIRDRYQELEQKIDDAKEHISGLDANRQEAYAGNIQWLNTTMRYISDRKATLNRVEQDGFENIKDDVEEQLYQVEEHLLQLESAIY